MLVPDKITEQNRFVLSLWDSHSSLWKDLDNHKRGIFYFIIIKIAILFLIENLTTFRVITEYKAKYGRDVKVGN